MALIVVANHNFIEVSLDGATNFDSRYDLVGLGLHRNAPQGFRIRKIIFLPSAVGDTVYVRDGINGPRAFSAVDVLGTYDVLKDEFREDGKTDRGKVMVPYINNAECVIGVANQAYVIFELG